MASWTQSPNQVVPPYPHNRNDVQQSWGQGEYPNPYAVPPIVRPPRSSSVPATAAPPFPQWNHYPGFSLPAPQYAPPPPPVPPLPPALQPGTLSPGPSQAHKHYDLFFTGHAYASHPTTPFLLSSPTSSQKHDTPQFPVPMAQPPPIPERPHLDISQAHPPLVPPRPYEAPVTTGPLNTISKTNASRYSNPPPIVPPRPPSEAENKYFSPSWGPNSPLSVDTRSSQITSQSQVPPLPPLPAALIQSPDPILEPSSTTSSVDTSFLSLSSASSPSNASTTSSPSSYTQSPYCPFPQPILPEIPSTSFFDNLLSPSDSGISPESEKPSLPPLEYSRSISGPSTPMAEVHSDLHHALMFSLSGPTRNQEVETSTIVESEEVDALAKAMADSLDISYEVNGKEGVKEPESPYSLPYDSPYDGLEAVSDLTQSKIQQVMDDEAITKQLQADEEELAAKERLETEARLKAAEEESERIVRALAEEEEREELERKRKVKEEERRLREEQMREEEERTRKKLEEEESERLAKELAEAQKIEEEARKLQLSEEEEASILRKEREAQERKDAEMARELAAEEQQHIVIPRPRFTSLGNPGIARKGHPPGPVPTGPNGSYVHPAATWSLPTKGGPSPAYSSLGNPTPGRAYSTPPVAPNGMQGRVNGPGLPGLPGYSEAVGAPVNGPSARPNGVPPPIAFGNRPPPESRSQSQPQVGSSSSSQSPVRPPTRASSASAVAASRPISEHHDVMGRSSSVPPNGAPAGSSRTQVVDGVDGDDLMKGVSYGFDPPDIRRQAPGDLPSCPPFPEVITLSRSPAPAFHIMAHSWRHLLGLLAQHETRLEVDIKTIAETKSTHRLRVVVQFVKLPYTANIWRTVIHLTLDEPIPSTVTNSWQYTNGDTTVLPYSYVYISHTHRHVAAFPGQSEIYVIPLSESSPLPILPISLANLALYLHSALCDSRARKVQNDAMNGMRRLAKLVNSLYPEETPASSQAEERKPNRGVGKLLKRVVRGNFRSETVDEVENEDTSTMIMPFRIDQYTANSGNAAGDGRSGSGAA